MEITLNINNIKGNTTISANNRLQTQEIQGDIAPQPIIETLNSTPQAAFEAQQLINGKANTITTEEISNLIRSKLQDGSHNLATVKFFNKVYDNSRFSDELFPVILHFIDTRGIDDIIKKLSEENSDTISGTTGELYHALALQEKGYRIVSFGFDIKRGKQKILETDLIIEKDSKYYFVEVKHFSGRRFYDKGLENLYADPTKWTEKFLLDVKDGLSNKLENYKDGIQLITSKESLPSFESQVGQESNSIRDYVRKFGVSILYSYTSTVGFSITKNGQSIIQDESNLLEPINNPASLNTRAEIERVKDFSVIEQTVGNYSNNYGYNISFERVPFKLFNKTTRTAGGENIQVNRNLSYIPTIPEVIDTKLFTSSHMQLILTKLKEENISDGEIKEIEDFISNHNFVGRSFNLDSLKEELKPLGKLLKAKMQLLKDIITQLFI